MLLSKANADIQTAKLLLSPVGNPTNDEQMTDLAAYHTQQGIEKVLKYVLHEGMGIDDTQRAYKTHNLFFLIDWIERESGFVVPDSLKEMADEITDWEAGSRYGESSIAEKNTIQTAIDIYEKLKISAVAYVNGINKANKSDDSDRAV